MSAGFFGSYIRRSAMKVAADERRRQAEEERLAEEQEAHLDAQPDAEAQERDTAREHHAAPEQHQQEYAPSAEPQTPTVDLETRDPEKGSSAHETPVDEPPAIEPPAIESRHIDKHTAEAPAAETPAPAPVEAPTPPRPNQNPRRLNWLVNFIEQEVADAQPAPPPAAATPAAATPTDTPRETPADTPTPSPVAEPRNSEVPARDATARSETAAPQRPSQQAGPAETGAVSPNREASGGVGGAARRMAERPAAGSGHPPHKNKPEPTQRGDVTGASPKAAKGELTLPPLTSPDADELPPLPPSRLDIERGESPFEIDVGSGFRQDALPDDSLPQDTLSHDSLPPDAGRTVVEVDDIVAPEPDRLFGDGFAGRDVPEARYHAPELIQDDEPAADASPAETPSTRVPAEDALPYADDEAYEIKSYEIPQDQAPYDEAPPAEVVYDEAPYEEVLYEEQPYEEEPAAPEPAPVDEVVEAVVAEEPVVEARVVDSVPDAPINEALVEEIRRKDRVVAMLLRKEIVSEQHVANAQRERERQGRKEVFWRVLASLSDVDTDAVYLEAARVYAFKTAEMGDGGFDNDFARSVMETFPEDKRDRLLELRVLPYQAEMEAQTGAIKLVFATHDPTRPEVHHVMQDLRLERFELRYAPESIVRAFVAEAFPKKNEYLERMTDGGMRFDLGASFDDQSQLIDEDALEAEISRSSLINLFEATLVEAVRRGASDIHIYPNAHKHIEIHFRVDGRLGHWHTEEKVHPEALLAVIKDNAMNVDRFERDSAQDGFIQRWIDDALIRFRVSVLPIANAAQELRSESIVIRVLDDRKVITDLKKLGLLDVALERFEMAIRQPHGMVILTGPTGSGKSTTLVAAMHQVVTPEVNVLTVEDPVEYIIPGVRQIKLNHKLGLEEALRAILRHDPDVVMVGEMRDRQTADLAIKLANTGHLTFSTLHTNDAPSAISRLFKMGIEPFLIAYAINMVVAQRLIRTLCPACKTVDRDPDPVMLKKLGFTDAEIAETTIYQTGHDPHCRSCKGMGYKGRRAVTEALYFSRPIRHMIVEAQNMIDEAAIRELAEKEGMLTLRDSARLIVLMGETSVTEMIRVVTTES